MNLYLGPHRNMAILFVGAKIKPINKQKLELLELEMRARAIKKMLASQQTEEEEEAVEYVSVTPPLGQSLIIMNEPLKTTKSLCNGALSTYHKPNTGVW